MSEEQAPNDELYEKAKLWEEARKHTFVGQIEQLKEALRELPPISWMDLLVERLFGEKK
jgi:hypothetical protein